MNYVRWKRHIFTEVVTINLIFNRKIIFFPEYKTLQREYKGTSNLGRMACGLSTGDMADDEREDSSEQEADYDDRDSGG